MIINHSEKIRNGQSEKTSTKLSNQYRTKKQNNFLKQLLDLLKVKPELINQDILPIILLQNQNQQNDKIIRNMKKKKKK